MFVRPNLYAPGRAHIVVYNWGHAGAVPVDVAAVLRSGDAYLVRSVQALFDPPLVSGVYTGGSKHVPGKESTNRFCVGGNLRRIVVRQCRCAKPARLC